MPKNFAELVSGDKFDRTLLFTTGNSIVILLMQSVIYCNVLCRLVLFKILTVEIFNKARDIMLFWASNDISIFDDWLYRGRSCRKSELNFYLYIFES